MIHLDMPMKEGGTLRDAIRRGELVAMPLAHHNRGGLAVHYLSTPDGQHAFKVSRPIWEFARTQRNPAMVQIAGARLPRADAELLIAIAQGETRFSDTDSITRLQELEARGYVGLAPRFVGDGTWMQAELLSRGRAWVDNHIPEARKRPTGAAGRALAGSHQAMMDDQLQAYAELKNLPPEVLQQIQSGGQPGLAITPTQARVLRSARTTMSEALAEGGSPVPIEAFPGFERPAGWKEFSAQALRAAKMRGLRPGEAKFVLRDIARQYRSLKGYDPMRANPLEKLYWIWAIPSGQSDRLYERPLTSDALTKPQTDQIKAAASKDGWHSFRLVEEKGGLPDFAGALNTRRRRNPVPVVADDDPEYQRIVAGIERLARRLERRQAQRNKVFGAIFGAALGAMLGKQTDMHLTPIVLTGAVAGWLVAAKMPTGFGHGEHIGQVGLR